jgi:hypothetical protein
MNFFAVVRFALVVRRRKHWRSIMTLSREQAAPKIRTWVLTEGDKLAVGVQEDTLDDVAFLLSWRILRESSHVFIDDDPDNNEYDTDLSIFELFCYYVFQIDVWLLRAKQEQFREKVFRQLVMPYCVSTFDKILKNDSLNDVLSNRLQFYSALMRTQSDPGKLVESLNEYFQQMIYWSQNHNENRVYDLDAKLAVFAMDFFKNFTLKVRIAAFVTDHFRALTDSINPIIQRMVKKGLIPDSPEAANQDLSEEPEQGKEYCFRCKKTVRATFHGCCPDCGDFLQGTSND